MATRGFTELRGSAVCSGCRNISRKRPGARGLGGLWTAASRMGGGPLTSSLPAASSHPCVEIRAISGVLSTQISSKRSIRQTNPDRRGDRMNRMEKLLVSFLLIGVLGGLAGLGVFGAFSSTTSNSGNSFAAGTVVIGDNDANSALYNV